MPLLSNTTDTAADLIAPLLPNQTKCAVPDLHLAYLRCDLVCLLCSNFIMVKLSSYKLLEFLIRIMYVRFQLVVACMFSTINPLLLDYILPNTVVFCCIVLLVVYLHILELFFNSMKS